MPSHARQSVNLRVHGGRALLIASVIASAGQAAKSASPASPPSVQGSGDPNWVDPFVPGTPTINSGYVLTHEHPTQGMSFGGNYAWAGPDDNYKHGGIMDDAPRSPCGGCSPLENCDHGEWKGNLTGLFSETADMGDHSSYIGPLHDSMSHLRYSTEWTQAAFEPWDPKYQDTSMKLMVAYAVENEAMCEQLHYANEGNGGAGEDYGCSAGDSEVSLLRQIDTIKNWVDANSGWMEIAYTGADARRIINNDKLAIVLGIEAEYAFGAEDRTFDPVQRLEEYFDEGVRTFYLAHKFNSRLAGADIYRSKESEYEDSGMIIRSIQAISGCFYYDDHIGDFPLANDNNHRFCDNDSDCGIDHFLGSSGLDNCNDKFSEISEANMYTYTRKGGGEFNGFAIYPSTPGFSGPGGTYMEGSIERNNLGLSVDGERVVRRAMELGMIITLDHVSSEARRKIYEIATEEFWKYPVNALHNNPNEMLVPTKLRFYNPWPNTDPILKHSGPSEYDFDARERDYIRHTEGIFGVRVGPINSAPWPESGVTANCPGTSTETAKTLAFLLDEGMKVGYSLDFATTTWGVLSRTFVGSVNMSDNYGWDYSPCGDALGPDNLHRYGFLGVEQVTEGLTHIGSMMRWHNELENIGLKDRYLKKLRNEGAEDFVEMWERSNFFATYAPQKGEQR